VQLPPTVRRRIEERTEEVGFAAMKRAAAELSDAYREGRRIGLDTPARVAAYLVTRMPATYAASYMVLEEVRQRLGPVETILDVGAGAGAASLAAREWFPEAQITMLEQQPGMADAARDWLPGAEVRIGDASAVRPASLVMAAYAMGEFGEQLAVRLWEAAETAMVVIEPGSPRGFALIRNLRGLGHIVAPCPGPMPCPMADGDWCHFGARVERSSLHRRVKGGELGYEDEKFSYVALAKEPVQPAHARILRRPLQNPGLIVLETCTPAGLATRHVGRRDKAAFRAARHAGWGQAIEAAPEDGSPI
jgi:ribosomal protein RSM22 (predicted rRNA methylase)